MTHEEMLEYLKSLDKKMNEAMAAVSEDKMMEAGIKLGQVHSKIKSTISFLVGQAAKAEAKP